MNEEIEIKLADEHYERVHKVGKRIEADVLAHAEHVLMCCTARSGRR